MRVVRHQWFGGYVHRSHGRTHGFAKCVRERRLAMRGHLRRHDANVVLVPERDDLVSDG